MDYFLKFCGTHARSKHRVVYEEVLCEWKLSVRQHDGVTGHVHGQATGADGAYLRAAHTSASMTDEDAELPVSESRLTNKTALKHVD